MIKDTDNISNNEASEQSNVDFRQDQNNSNEGQEPTAKQTRRQLIERFLKQRYSLRFNELTGGIEYKPIKQTEWLLLNDYSVNSICRIIDRELNLSITAGMLMEYLRSDFVTAYHPLKAYFQTLPTRTGTATIDELASTVAVNNPDLFRQSLMRWLVASIDNAMTPNDCQNHTCFVLTGGQGAYKSTWLNLLCPNELKKYHICGKIDLQAKDTLILLGTMFLINLDDQLRALNKKDDETLKTIITHPNITVRRPYDKYPSYLSRIASFCGSINSNEFLTDPTGSRRFLPFAVDSIDIEQAKSVDINQVWAEAYTLFKDPDFKHWYTADEFTRLFGNNDEFQVATEEYEILHGYYEVVQDALKADFHANTTNVLIELQNKTHLRLSSKRLGEALKKSKGIQRTSRQNGGGKVWYLRRRSDAEIEQRSKSELPVEVSMTAVASE